MRPSTGLFRRTHKNRTTRSEEHTSELQSRLHLVCRLLLEKKKNSHTNHLAREKSPYLLQHAHNPVDWFPWDEPAFAKARQENKPIFLSIGYSTCHWSHVM